MMAILGSSTYDLGGVGISSLYNNQTTVEFEELEGITSPLGLGNFAVLGERVSWL